MQVNNDILQHLEQHFGVDAFRLQHTVDEILTLWLPKDKVVPVIKYLKLSIKSPFNLLYDLSGTDERDRAKKEKIPAKDFTIVYHLFSFGRNSFIRLKVALEGETPSMPSITSLFKNANWYEREVYDMFGIHFEGHPHLQRILMPLTWKGHPLRKEHPARATEIGPYKLFDELQDREQMP
jgi:NADH-quinone oxidoreductase subunit C/D